MPKEAPIMEVLKYLLMIQKNVEGAIISSVVPDVTLVIKDASDSLFRLMPLF